jgi:hypothetical protein
MPKYTILSPFTGGQEARHFKRGEVVDFTTKRADEITDKLGASYLELVDEPKKQSKKDKLEKEDAE